MSASTPGVATAPLAGAGGIQALGAAGGGARPPPGRRARCRSRPRRPKGGGARRRREGREGGPPALSRRPTRRLGDLLKVSPVGIIGMGFGQKIHGPGFFHPDRFEVAAVAGARPASAVALAGDGRTRRRRPAGARRRDGCPSRLDRDGAAPVRAGGARGDRGTPCPPRDADGARRRRGRADRGGGAVRRCRRGDRLRVGLPAGAPFGVRGAPPGHARAPRGSRHDPQRRAGEAGRRGRELALLRAETGGGYLGAVASHAIDTL